MKTTKPKTTSPTAALGPPRWESSELSYLAGRAHLDAADHLAAVMERKWGVGRLRLLVTHELREKFDRQRAKLNLAIHTGELAELTLEADRMCTAWRALDRAADTASAAPLSPLVWDVTLPDGSVAALVQTPEDARAVVTSGRQVAVWTVAEIAQLIHNFPGLVKAKEIWPGATVETIRRPTDPLEDWEADGDAMPF